MFALLLQGIDGRVTFTIGTFTVAFKVVVTNMYGSDEREAAIRFANTPGTQHFRIFNNPEMFFNQKNYLENHYKSVMFPRQFGSCGLNALTFQKYRADNKKMGIHLDRNNAIQFILWQLHPAFLRFLDQASPADIGRGGRAGIQYPWSQEDKDMRGSVEDTFEAILPEKQEPNKQNVKNVRQLILSYSITISEKPCSHWRYWLIINSNYLYGIMRRFKGNRFESFHFLLEPLATFSSEFL